MIFCTNCGAKLDDNQKFCITCDAFETSASQLINENNTSIEGEIFQFESKPRLL
ncbi:MAG: zinc-ribbon domain-containing protein [Clostridium sp.]|uniref:zinc-ribbon domain-containing protein n=1 Tax=Clostridium sp. TaxID=1506 RepID=UPI003D6CF9B6